jgi:hypothetical protein
MDIEPRISHHSGHGRTSSLNWGQPEPFSRQTNPREECPAYSPRRSTQRATYGIGSSHHRRPHRPSIRPPRHPILPHRQNRRGNARLLRPRHRQIRRTTPDRLTNHSRHRPGHPGTHTTLREIEPRTLRFRLLLSLIRGWPMKFGSPCRYGIDKPFVARTCSS